MKQFSISILGLLLLTFTSYVGAGEGWTSLMPEGKNLTWTQNGEPTGGWVKYGGDATYEFDGESILGVRGPGNNTFLCTEKRFTNFILKCDVKYEVDCNSGIQFRSNLRKTKPEDQNGVVFGYQYEIATNGNVANIYDESRRGRWLEPISEDAQKKGKEIFKNEEWNEIQIQCVGPSIKTWINGEKVSDLIDVLDNEGFFGLQVHGGDQGKVRWKNIRIQELPATPWISLYSDKKFGDVEEKPVGKWEIQEDGAVLGTTESGQAKDGMVLSKQSYKDFAVKVSFKAQAGNSGLYFRAAEVDKPYWLKGFQCEIAEGGVCANLWEVEGRGWVAKTPATEAAAQKVYSKEWNDIATVAIGDHLVTFLNGQKIVDIMDPPCAKEGKTGLQLHGGGDQGFLFKEYWIMPLDEKAVELIQK